MVDFVAAGERWKLIVDAVHVGVYDYSNVVYTGSHNKVDIVCAKHGIFNQSPQNHKRSGCPTCGIEQRSTQKTQTRKKKGRVYYIDRAVGVHGDKYDYRLLSDDIGSKDVCDILCDAHGKFSQRMGDHVRGQGCPKCAAIARASFQADKHHINYYIGLSKTVHGDVYDYSLVGDDTTSVKTKVNIICTKHGMFTQSLDKHIYAATGCPVCGSVARSSYTESRSKGEQSLCDFVSLLGFDVEHSNRTLIYPQELDIYIPSKKLAIEYNGLYWHSEQQGKGKWYHKQKTLKCRDQGVRLIHIFEDEWILSPELVKQKIKYILGLNTEGVTHARKCEFVTVNTQVKIDFFNTYHIQGNGPSSINVGLMSGGELVAVMGFIVTQKRHYLNRYATKGSVVGGFSKLLKYFQQEHNWVELVSFADIRWSEGDLYLKTGWELDTVLAPDYQYIVHNQRVHKFNFRHKFLKKRLKAYDPLLSERENCAINNIPRVWDCGKNRYMIKNKQGGKK